MKCTVTFILWLTMGLKVKGQDTATIYFETGRSEVTTQARRLLDSFFYHSTLPLNSQVYIYGFTDSVGDTSYNNRLSAARAESVKEYLMTSGVEENNILTTIGLGERSVSGKDKATVNADDRRVDVVRGYSKGTDAVKNIDVRKLRKGETIVLRNINFYENTTKFKPEAYAALEELLQIMKQNKTLKIRLQGHTCCSYNISEKLQVHFRQLSLWRAREVYFFLKWKGIDISRMVYRGFGGTKPMVHPELTAADRYQNMRVEVKVLEI